MELTKLQTGLFVVIVLLLLVDKRKCICAAFGDSFKTPIIRTRIPDTFAEQKMTVPVTRVVTV